MDVDRYTYELEQFGKRLRKIRLSKNLRQLDIEVATGIDRTDISRIENGQKNIEFYTMVRIAEALEIELSKLFTYTIKTED